MFQIERKKWLVFGLDYF